MKRTYLGWITILLTTFSAHTHSQPEPVELLKILNPPQLNGHISIDIDRANSSALTNYTSSKVLACRESDSLALVALYNATDGLNWRVPWNLARPVAGWWGITLNDQGCVIEIRLWNSNLKGKLPEELGQLSNLSVLSLSENQLTGGLPESLTELDSLTEITLSINELSGPILVSIGQLSNLTALWLNDNRFTGPIPSEMGELSLLEHLSLGKNELSEQIPGSIGQLLKLRYLDISQNQLTGKIPLSLGNLDSLELLSLPI